jgi:signal transduction histidine kinase
LRGGKPCYIEAIREQRGGSGDNLAVAWQGPGLQQSVIAGDFLSPWMDRYRSLAASARGRTRGVLQEVWTNYFVGAVEPLTVRGPLATPVTVNTPRFDTLGRGTFPAPLPIRPGEAFARHQHFRWIELEGTVAFVSKGGGELTLELADGQKRTRVRVRDWMQEDWPRLENARVRVRGVGEAALDADGQPVIGLVWAPSPAEVVELKTSADWSGLKLTPISQLAPTNPDLAWGRRIRVRGTVTPRDDGTWFVQGTESFWAYLSRDGTNWEQVAPPIEIGMGDDPQVGLVVTSLNPDSLATAVFDRVEGLNGVGKQTDVNESKPLGSASLMNSTYTLKGGGRGIGSAFDEFHFAHQPLRDVTQFVARVNRVEGDNPRAGGGIMIRENLDGVARCVALTVTPMRTARLMVRRKEDSRGEIVEIPGFAAPCWLKLTRREFALLARPEPGATARTGQEVDVTGFLTWEAGHPVLRDALCLESSPRKPVQPAVAPGSDSFGGGVQVARIADIIPQEGTEWKDGSGIVQVRGVVTFFDVFNRANYLAIQDESGGAWVRLSGRFARRPLLQGQIVEVEVKSANGKWPVPFEIGRLSVLGSGQLPEPVVHPAEYSLPLRGEGRWVELEGIVRSATSEGTLTVMGKDGAMPVWIGGLRKGAAGAYVDSFVRVRGTLVRTEADALVLLASSSALVQVSEPPPTEPFVIPAIEIVSLKKMNFSPARTHRLKVRGAVTYKDDTLLLVQDKSGGVRVQTARPASFNVGEVIEAAGFPELGGGGFTLAGALVRKTGATAESQPATRSVEALLEGDFDATVARVRAVLLERQTRGARQLLELQSGQRIFQAVLARDGGELPAIPSGSVVELTGVCWAEKLGGAASSEGGRPIVSSFQLLLRKPGDVKLVQRPPWWTWKHTSAVVSALGMILLGALVWIRQLHRQVAERTLELRATMARLEEETKTSATLAERNRLAAEIHDGLEQGLNGIMMQLDGVETKLNRSPDAAKQHLDLARRMVRFSRTEVRHSLWDWKTPALAAQDLKAALAEIVSQMAKGNIARVAVEVSGSSRVLPPAMEHHLLRICQEALTNALKHSQARNIAVKLNYTADAVELSVRDDGRGFVPDTVLNGMVGHLGLQNLRSRARQLHGELTVTSAPDKGATIAVRIPCPPGDAKAN